jgi:hypothetical protein
MSLASDVREFDGQLRKVDASGALIVAVRPGRNEHQVDVTVANQWHREPYQIRLQAAQNIWQAWAQIRAPKNPDLARIKIVDLNGNEVGGSRVLAGSLIWVQD